MPKVLHLLQCTNLGGMEKAAADSMRLLRDRGLSFSVATPRPFGLGKGMIYEFDPRASDHEYAGKYGWRTHRSFSRIVAEKSTDCSHVWITGSDIACLRAANRLSLPAILSHHYHHFDDKWSYLRWKLFYELACHRLKAITYPTDFTRNEALRIAPWLRSRSHVVRLNFPVCVAPETKSIVQQIARRKLGIAADALVVGNAGWLVRRKRWDVFLDVARRVCQVRRDSIFIICGGGPDEAALRKRASEDGLAKNIVFAGWISDIDDYFDAFDILLFNSDFDTLPRTPCEAAARGCVVVGSLQYGGLSEFLKDGVNGRLLREHDTHELARTILELAANPGKSAEWRARACETLREKFSAEQSIAFYRSSFA